ncbi:MAG: cytochrome c [Gammaproteobacteria bacterium]|nr:cytochrome c [Gammaproteobacteria bacterium]
MTIKILAMLVVIGSLFPGFANTHAAELDTPRQDVRLPPDLLNLLREEMREIAAGIQGIALFLATADWKSIQETSAKIRASYIMEKKLTAAQAKELEQALPGQFKQLDSEFHQRAEKLGMAAAAHDPELAAFQFSRLVESCALCHTAYAKSRFPEFVSPVQHEHHH